MSKAKKSEICVESVYCSESWGCGAPGCVRSDTDFWIASDLTLSVWSAAVAFELTGPTTSRPSTGVHVPLVLVSSTAVAAAPVPAFRTAFESAFVRGTDRLNVTEASVEADVPVMLAKRRVSVPPGVVVLGVDGAVVVPDVASTEMNCALPGSTSVRSRFVTVWPFATSTATVYCRGQFGPVVVSLSGPAYVVERRRSVGETAVVAVLPISEGSVVGLSSASVPNMKPPLVLIVSGTFASARFEVDAVTAIGSAGCDGT